MQLSEMANHLCYICEISMFLITIFGISKFKLPDDTIVFALVVFLIERLTWWLLPSAEPVAAAIIFLSICLLIRVWRHQNLQNDLFIRR